MLITKRRTRQIYSKRKVKAIDRRRRPLLFAIVDIRRSQQFNRRDLVTLDTVPKPTLNNGHRTFADNYSKRIGTRAIWTNPLFGRMFESRIRIDICNWSFGLHSFDEIELFRFMKIALGRRWSAGQIRPAIIFSW